MSRFRHFTIRVPSAAADLVRPVSRALLTTPAPQGEVSAVLLRSGEEAPEKLDVPIGRTVSKAFRMLGLAWLWVFAAVAVLLTTGSVILAAVPAGIYLASRRYLLWRYCIRARVQGRFLELGNVSDGFRARVESVVAQDAGGTSDRPEAQASRQAEGPVAALTLGRRPMARATRTAAVRGGRTLAKRIAAWLSQRAFLSREGPDAGE